jgi:D-aspartate ligase
MTPVDSSVAAAPAIVIGLDCITGLQSARLLADRGVPVIGLAANPRHFCARTRVCRQVVAGPTSGPALIATLKRLAASTTGPLVALPCTDAAVKTLAEARAELPEQVRIVLPSADVVETLMDKTHFAERATDAGWPIPVTRILRSRGDAERAAAELPFPAVLKPGIKSSGWVASTTAKALPVTGPAELLETYDRVHTWADALIVQEWIDGGEEDLYSFNGYFDRSSRPLVTFIARKIRQWPPQTGTSCLGVEVRDDAVLTMALELFESVGYQGLAYLEVKRDPNSGRYAIIEPNVGRPTGRSAIAERGGVELLLTAYRDTLGLPLPEGRTQHYTGVKWIHLRHDLQAAIHAWRLGELSIREWWGSVRGPKLEAVISLRDPLPSVAEVGYTLSKAMATLRRR